MNIMTRDQFREKIFDGMNSRRFNNTHFDEVARKEKEGHKFVYEIAIYDELIYSIKPAYFTIYYDNFNDVVKWIDAFIDRIYSNMPLTDINEGNYINHYDNKQKDLPRRYNIVSFTTKAYVLNTNDLANSMKKSIGPYDMENPNYKHLSDDNRKIKVTDVSIYIIAYDVADNESEYDKNNLMLYRLYKETYSLCRDNYDSFITVFGKKSHTDAAELLIFSNYMQSQDRILIHQMPIELGVRTTNYLEFNLM